MNGVVAAGHLATAEAAGEILRAGGNAVDAAVAGALAAFVAEPLLCGAGGGGMMAACLDGGRPEILDFFSDAPGLSGPPDAGALDFAAIMVDFGTVQQEFHVGRGAVAVPGALPGLALACDRHGSLPLADLAAPACRLAEEGVTVTPETAHVFDLLWPILSRDPETAATLASTPRSDPRIPEPGDILRNPALAATLMTWSERVPGDRYSGDRYSDSEGAGVRYSDEMVARLVREFGTGAGGLITEEDVRAYRPQVLEPVEIRVGEYAVELPPRVGGRLVAVILESLVKGGVVSPARDGRGPGEAEEMLRLAKASAVGSTARDALIVPPDLPGSTTHVSVMDARGGVAAVTLSNGEGCGHLLGDTGVQLNNFLGEEDLNPHGFHRHAPGSRLPTMMAPVVVRRAGQPALALGSGGANRIRTALAQTLYRTLARGQSLEQAVRSARFHAEDDQVWFEDDGLASADAVEATLAREFARIHRFPGRAFFFGGVHAAGMGEDGRPHAVGDDRRGGAAIVL